MLKDTKKLKVQAKKFFKENKMLVCGFGLNCTTLASHKQKHNNILLAESQRQQCFNDVNEK